MATINTGLIVPEVYAELVREKIAGRVQVAQFLKTIDTLRNDVGETITMPAWSYVGDASDWTVGTAMTTKSMVQTKKLPFAAPLASGLMRKVMADSEETNRTLVQWLRVTAHSNTCYLTENTAEEIPPDWI